MTTTDQINKNPFVSIDDKNTIINAEDTLKLLQSLNMDQSSNKELKEIYELAKNGESVDRETLMNTVGSLLANDSQHLNELVGSIGNFDIHFK